MRVALVNTLFRPHLVGGAERSVDELATGLSERGHDVAVFTLTPNAQQSRTEDPAGFAVHRIPLADDWPFGEHAASRSALQRLAWHVRESHRSRETAALSRALRDFEPDVLHTNNIAGFGTGVWGVLGDVPVVHTVRDYYLLCVRTTQYREDLGACAAPCRSCRALTVPRRHSRHRPDVVVGLTQHVLDVHRDVFPAGQPVRVIGNAPTPVPVVPRTVHRLSTVGYLGRLEQAKGLPMLLDAVAAVGDLQLVVAGGGTPDQEAQVRARAERDPSVVFLGRAAPADILDRVDVLAVPTQWAEPFGRVAAEARAAGLPVLASRAGGLPESLDGHPHARFVDDYVSPAGWTRALREWRDAWEPVAVGAGIASPVADVVGEYEALYAQVRSLRRTS